MKLKSVLSLLSLAVCAAVSTSALAQSGTIDINGNITSTGCTPSLSGSVSGTTVNLDSVSIENLNANPGGIGEKPFTFDFAGCDVVPSTTQVWVHFGGGDTNSNGRISTNTGSNKVSFQLKDGLGGAVIKAGGAAPSGGAPGSDQGTSVGFSGASLAMVAHKTYAVEYYRETGVLDASDAGAVAGSVDYTVVYD